MRRSMEGVKEGGGGRAREGGRGTQGHTASNSSTRQEPAYRARFRKVNVGNLCLPKERGTRRP